MTTDTSISGQELLLKMAFEHASVALFTLLDDVVGTSEAGRWSRPVIEQIDALQAGADDEVPPTEYAYERARSIIEEAYGRIDSSRAKKRLGVPEIFPRPFVTTDDVGGIRLSWRLGSKLLRANFGARPELQSYIYFESGLEHDAEELSVENLAGRLAWLTGR
jgi:hypothetical protein